MNNRINTKRVDCCYPSYNVVDETWKSKSLCASQRYRCIPANSKRVLWTIRQNFQLIFALYLYYMRLFFTV